jgi:multiple sugar transport system substrate-binding protein
MTDLDRRKFVSGAAALPALGLLPRHAWGQAAGGPLNVFGHRVMQTVSTGSQGGDITKPWSEKSGVTVQWTTFDTGPLQERLFREASLNETSVDVGFLLNTQAAPRVSQLFEPLDEYMKKDPIEAPDDVFPGLMEGMKVGGKLVAIPFRHASSGLHYNEQLLSEKGFKKPPETIEEMVAIAKACSGPRDGGPPVVGLITPGVTYPNVIDIARAWDGDFITPDFKYVGDQEPMLNAVKLLRDLFDAKAFPRNFATLSPEDVNVWMQQGRAALSLQSMGRNRIYNDPQKSQFSGKIKTVAVPISASLKSKYAVAPAKVEFWGLVIPRNAKRKDLSWSFIKAMLTRPATLGAALNGNGPVRNSTYEDAGFRSQVPYADEERRVLKVARVPLPAFDEANRAGDFFKEEVEAAVLGLKKVEEAMASLGQRVKPLLPT